MICSSGQLPTQCAYSGRRGDDLRCRLVHRRDRVQAGFAPECAVLLPRWCRRGERRSAPVTSTRPMASAMPCATTSPRVMPPKMLIRIACTFGSAVTRLNAFGDLLGAGAAADIEEVGRLAAVELDRVHRRHRQTGAVDDAADVAVELDERDAGALAPRSRSRSPRPYRAALRIPGGGRARCRRS